MSDKPVYLRLSKFHELEVCDSIVEGAEQYYPASAYEALKVENKELKEDLQFVERWANHHGTKPNITAKEALSCIQHYPSIAAITKSYKDGVIPSTRNPYDELEALKAENEAQAKRIAELESEIGWINSLQGEDVMYETILSRAKQSYIRHKFSAKGQMFTRNDDFQTHVIHAAIEYAASKNGHSK